MILVIIKENPQITREEIAEMVGVGRTTIMKDLRVLKEQYGVRYEGASKTGRWVVGKEKCLFDSYNNPANSDEQGTVPVHNQ